MLVAWSFQLRQQSSHKCSIRESKFKQNVKQFLPDYWYEDTLQGNAYVTVVLKFFLKYN